MGKTKVLAGVFVALALGGAANAAGVVKRDVLLKVEPGLSKAEITTLLGSPGNRTFRDTGEAWQYCRTGISTDEYTTIWFREGKVISLTTLNAAIATGSCSGRWPPVDWGQMPPNVRIEVEQR